MCDVLIVIKEEQGIKRSSQPATISIPFKRGLFPIDQEFTLLDDLNVKQQHQVTILSTWNDKSIKWLKLDFIVNVDANRDINYRIKPETIENYNAKPQFFENYEEKSEITLTTLNKLSCNVDTLANSISITNLKNKYKTELKFLLQNSAQEVSNVEIKTIESINFNSHSLKSKIKLKGIFQGGIELLNFEMTLTFYADSTYIKIDFTLHNPKTAEHKGGLWDLGDNNSINFQSLSLNLSIENCHHIEVIDHVQNNSFKFEDNVDIQQLASGGKNWNSPVHKNAQGKVDLKNNGFKISTINSDIAEQIKIGLRISPTIKVKGNNHTVTAYIEKFWQNYPKAISINGSSLNLDLFPKGLFELQGGEKKTHSIWLDFNAADQNFNWVDKPLNITLEPSYIASTNTLEYLKVTTQQDELLSIINKGIVGKDTFFDKREVVDEYGWRNFGELYADHENERYQGTDIFVSHYNNQYDPIYGFIYQFVLTGEYAWFELANDLANHVKDIDIYHTKHDKDEYNGGLFWHTDHYLEASTCTHRTFSKNHQAAYEGYTSGGGPGGQHCYTTGLKSHYFLTGEESSKQAVLQLTDWITYSFEGSNTFIAKIFAIKQSGKHGVKNHLTEQYPLDRGTGHYVIALLDSFDLTNEKSYLNKAFNIIKHTIHPCDDISMRDFDNIENTWFYTVFLQAVGRFLLVKELLEQLDEDFYYARDALLHYVDWMCEYEKPYLNQKEKLEFPNATWTGQDLRKVGIFYIANYYSALDNIQYLNKAEYFYQYIINNLILEPSSNYTRIRVLLMQNYGCAHFYKNKSKSCCFEAIRTYSKREVPFKVLKIVKILTKELLRLSINKELKWLSLRSTKVSKLLGNKF